MELIYYILLGLVAQVIAFVLMLVAMFIIFLNPDSYVRAEKGIAAMAGMADKMHKSDAWLSTWLIFIWPVGVFLQWGLPVYILTLDRDEDRQKWLERYCLISIFRRTP